MARIRTIKPEFPQSESVGTLSREARLLFIQLWTIVDDDGRTRAASRMLASLLYPYDDDARTLIEGWLSELDRGNHIRRYEVDGSQYLEIVKWLEHQKIDRPSKSRLPSFDEGSRLLARVREGSATDLVPSTMDLVSGSDAGARAPDEPKPEKKSRKKPRQQISDDFKFSERVRAYGAKLNFTSAEIDREEQRLIRHAKQNARICADWDMAAENWLDKAAEFAGKPPPVDSVKAAEAASALQALFYAKADSPQLDAWDAYYLSVSNKRAQRDRLGGWYFKTEWPPGHEPSELTTRHIEPSRLKSMGGLN